MIQSLAHIAILKQRTQNSVECAELFQSRYFFSIFWVFLEIFVYIHCSKKIFFFLHIHGLQLNSHQVQYHKQDQLAQIFHRLFLFIVSLEQNIIKFRKRP